MNKLLVALIAGGFATVAAAQTAAPAAAPATKKEMNAEKAKEVGTVTKKESDTSGTQATAAEQKANTAASKKVAKPTTAQKKADAVCRDHRGWRERDGRPGNGRASQGQHRQVEGNGEANGCGKASRHQGRSDPQGSHAVSVTSATP